MPPVIALLTDFGTSDPYVGAMKGAILSACPEATLVDVLHEVPSHDVLRGALALESAYAYFPPDTVFVAVVDPGVGTRRRAVAAAAGQWLFVAPDNGVLSLVLEAHPGSRVHLLANPRLFRQPVSPVFHGRDVFGPAAGHLARGLALADVGPPLPDAVRLPPPLRVRRGDRWEGVVLSVDRFGNMITSLTAADVDSLGAGDRGAEVALGAARLPLVRTYGDVAEGAVCALVGSSGRIEIAANRRRAADQLGAGVGSILHLARRGS